MLMKAVTCMFSCFLASLIVCLSVCFHHELSETKERVSVGLERLCSELARGQMWFNPLRKSLYLCDGAVWISVLEGENPQFQKSAHEQVFITFKIDKMFTSLSTQITNDLTTSWNTRSSPPAQRHMM